MLLALAAGLLTTGFLVGLGEEIGMLIILTGILSIPACLFLIPINSAGMSLIAMGPNGFLLNQLYFLTIVPIASFVLMYLASKIAKWGWFGAIAIISAGTTMLGAAIFFFLGMVSPIALMFGDEPSYPYWTTDISILISVFVGIPMLIAMKKLYMSGGKTKKYAL